MVRLLFDKGADIKAAGDVGETALGCAAMAGQVDVVKLLLDKGADINAKDKWGLTPLGTAEAQLKISMDIESGTFFIIFTSPLHVYSAFWILLL